MPVLRVWDALVMVVFWLLMCSVLVEGDLIFRDGVERNCGTLALRRCYVELWDDGGCHDNQLK